MYEPLKSRQVQCEFEQRSRSLNQHLAHIRWRSVVGILQMVNLFNLLLKSFHFIPGKTQIERTATAEEDLAVSLTNQASSFISILL